MRQLFMQSIETQFALFLSDTSKQVEIVGSTSAGTLILLRQERNDVGVADIALRSPVISGSQHCQSPHSTFYLTLWDLLR